MNLYCGIDIGSSYIKTVFINDESQIIAHRAVPTGSSFKKNALTTFEETATLNQINLSDIKYTIATGYGRKLYTAGDETISEISCNAKGVFHSFKQQSIGTIINIGGQDSKVIILDENGLVLNFAMNDKCAAGTGKFLEMASRNLEVDIEDMEILHKNLKGIPASINSTCTVFAESEIISLLSKGTSREEIAAGVHYSISKRIARLANRAGIKDNVVLDGGAALNKGVIKALEDELMRSILIPKLPQFTTAYGAAILAKESFVN